MPAKLSVKQKVYVNRKTKSSRGRLGKYSGFEAIRVGGIDQSIRIEVFGDLYEFGALGKPVTRAGLKQLA